METAPSARPHGSRLVAWTLVSLATLSLGLVLVVLTEDALVSAIRGPFRLIAAAALLGSTVVIVTAWVSVNTRPRVTAGLALVGIALLWPLAAAWAQINAPLRGAMASLAPLAIAGAAQVGLLWSPRAHRPVALALISGLAAFAVVILFIGFNPFDEPNCGLLCLDIRPPGAGLVSSRTALGVGAVSGGASALVAGFTLIRGSKLVPPAVLVSVVLAVACMATPALVRWIRWSATPTTPELAVLPFLAALVLSGSVILAVLRDRRTRSSLRELVDYVTDPTASVPHPGSPVTTAQFFVPHTGRWVDAVGQSATDRDGPAVIVSDSEGPVVRLFVQPGYRSGDVIDAMTPALRLAVKTTQLIAISRANLAEVRASRRRIVATSDAERRRIERDLHDGAQQRLVGAMFYLSLAKARPGTPKDDIAQIEEEVSRAIKELRSLAHGVFPALLSHEGLWAALDELCRTSAMRVDLDVSGADDLGLEPAMAAYALVTRALDMANVGSAPRTRVAVRCSAGESLRVRTEVPDLGWNEDAWIDVIDRIGAVGGDLVTSSEKGRLIIQAELPCE
jgi:signal transduction histidine kinase